jgi:hypothetical protein
MAGMVDVLERSAERTLDTVDDTVLHGVDRFVKNVQHGRFEQALSALTAGAALVNGVEIWLEHDRASFGDPWMWAPVALTPLAMAGAVAGVLSPRAAKTVLPVASAIVVANGLQGFYLHARGVARKPGGWRMLRYNLEMGPPLFAPLLMTTVGGMGLLASVLRRS